MSEPEMTPDTVTFISRHSPYGRDNALICLDLVLAYSVFDQKVNFLFVDEGVLQLVKGQQPEQIASKNLSAALGALEVYGVEHVFVDKLALQEHGLALDDLVIKPQVLDTDQLRELVTNSAMVYAL